MKISYNWLKQYLDGSFDASQDFDSRENLNADQVAAILTDVGLEVEGIEKFESIKGSLDGLVIGFVKEIEKHPDADRLRITKVDTGTGTDLQIVCGAANVAQGQKVLVALQGATLYPHSGEPIIIKKSKIRGATSEGMICAEDEIGLSNNHEGIMILPADLTPGLKASEYFKPYNDYTIDVAITPNRGDAMSHIGMARDIAAWLQIHQQKNVLLKIPGAKISLQNNLPADVDVKIENTNACHRYAGITISGITVKESPQWLQYYLKTCGLKPINNIVDITNYVMMETGQPLHAFDRDAIKGDKIIIKNLPTKTSFISLDNKEIKLSDDDLMICNAEEGMCMAGVYGGLHSGVTFTTKNIFLESAWFHPISIRKTSNRHQLRTDAALRFEKIVNIENTVLVLNRAVDLILEIAGGSISSSLTDIYPVKNNQTIIAINYNNLNKTSVYTIEKNVADKILTALGFTKQEDLSTESKWLVPGYKSDCTIEEDLMEEIMRINGYEKVPVSDTFKASLSYSNDQQLKEKFINHIQNFLSNNGFNEVQNNSIASASASEKYFPETKEEIIPLLAYSNAGLDAMRSNMILPLLNVLKYNINRKQADLKLYETGKIYFKRNGKYLEQEKLVILITGNNNEEHWRNKSSKSDLYHLKSVIEMLLNKLGIQKVVLTENNNSLFNYSLKAELLNKKFIEAGSIRTDLLIDYDVKQEVFYAEIDLEVLFQQSKKQEIKFREPSKYPMVRRDLAMLLPKEIKYEALEKIAFQYGGKQLQEVSLFDIYEDKKLGESVKSYAVSFIFMDENKTLADADVDDKIQKLITQFETQLQAKVRK